MLLSSIQVSLMAFMGIWLCFYPSFDGTAIWINSFLLVPVLRPVSPASPPFPPSCSSSLSTPASSTVCWYIILNFQKIIWGVLGRKPYNFGGVSMWYCISLVIKWAVRPFDMKSRIECAILHYGAYFELPVWRSTTWDRDPLRGGVSGVTGVLCLRVDSTECLESIERTSSSRLRALYLLGLLWGTDGV